MTLTETATPLEVADFLALHDKKGKVAGTNRANVEHLAESHLNADTIVVHRDLMGEIDGILIWDRYAGDVTVEDVLRWRPNDPNGKTILIGWMLSLSRDITRQLVLDGLDVIGGPDGFRFAAIRNGRVRYYPNNIVNRILN